MACKRPFFWHGLDLGPLAMPSCQEGRKPCGHSACILAEDALWPNMQVLQLTGNMPLARTALHDPARAAVYDKWASDSLEIGKKIGDSVGPKMFKAPNHMIVMGRSSEADNVSVLIAKMYGDSASDVSACSPPDAHGQGDIMPQEK
eukprot:184458-Chlamydomonas_euryale.AAC.1